LLAAETLDYGKEALGYYQKCVSLLPHLAGLTASDLKQAKVPRPPPNARTTPYVSRTAMTDPLFLRVPAGVPVQ
jgi:hypothetical protein